MLNERMNKGMKEYQECEMVEGMKVRMNKHRNERKSRLVKE